MALSAQMLELLNKKKMDIKARSGDKAAELKPGKNRLRVFPAKDGGKYWHDFGQHWIKDENKKVLGVIGCTDVAYEQPCDTCAMLGRAAHACTDDATLLLIAEAKKVPRRVLINAQHRLGDQPELVQITQVPQSVFEQILNTQIEYADEFGDVLDLEAGLDFIIERSGIGLDTTYSVTPAPKASAIKDAATQMANLPSLEDYVRMQGQFETGKAKAISAISTISGMLPMIGAGPSASSAGALTGPKAAAATKAAASVIEGKATEVRDLGAVIEDELPDDAQMAANAAAAAKRAQLAAAVAAKKAAAVTDVVDEAPAVKPAAANAASDEDELAKALAELDL